MPALVNTLIITALSLLIAVPIGVFAAIFLVEYANRGSRLVSLIRITTETLSGIPSIIYGLFGLLFFTTALKWGFSLLSGSLTLVIMILPLVIRTTEEALKSVPDFYRAVSYTHLDVYKRQERGKKHEEKCADDSDFVLYHQSFERMCIASIF